MASPPRSYHAPPAPSGKSSVKNGLKPKGVRPPRYTGPAQNFRHSFPTTPSNDQVPGGIPNEFLVTPYTDQQIQTLAHGRADADVAAGLAALPTEDQVRHPYDQASAATAGLTDALVQALQGTQHFQVGAAPAISGQYAQGATADQSGADAAAAALGGQASQLAGSTGGAATALAVPAVSAANATSGVIDAAHLRGANEQINLDDRLTQSLLGLQNQQAAVRAKGVSAFDQYVDGLNQQNQQAQAANATNSLNYAHLGIDQQNANNGTQQLANQIAIANAQNQRITNTTNATNQTRTNTANTTANATNARNQETHRHNVATEAAATYRNQHPTTGAAGTARDPQTGYTPSQTTTHISTDIHRALSLAQAAHKPAGGGSPGQVNFNYRYHPVNPITHQPDPSHWSNGAGHVQAPAWQQFVNSGAPGHRNWSILGVNRPGAEVTQFAKTGGASAGGPSVGYWAELERVKQYLAQQNGVGHYQWDDPTITRYAQQILRQAGYNPQIPQHPTGTYDANHPRHP